MEEKKLTDEEIVKALDICTTADDDMDCSDGCPMYEEDYCTTKLLKMAFDLIQRLRSENARLKYALLEAKNNMLAYGSACVKEGYEKAKEQIEQLMEERENMQAEIMRFEDMKFTQEHCNLYEENEWLKASLQRSVKDMAKEILQYVGDLYDDCDQRFQLKDYQWHKELCKKYGVEVE